LLWLGGRLPGLIWPEVPFTPNPLRFAARAARAAVSLGRRLRNRVRYARGERLEEGWALVNDEAYDQSMLLVYVDPARERQALLEAGFTPGVTCLGMDGAPTEGHDGAHAWIHYIARKPMRGPAPGVAPVDRAPAHSSR
jgi:hypothetical protein